MDRTSIREEAAETPSEQQSPERTSAVQNDSECAFWVPSDLDSDEAEQVNEEEADTCSSQVEEKSTHDVAEDKSHQSSSQPSSKKGRKRKRLAQALATVKKQKLVINKIPMSNKILCAYLYVFRV